MSLSKTFKTTILTALTTFVALLIISKLTTIFQSNQSNLLDVPQRYSSVEKIAAIKLRDAAHLSSPKTVVNINLGSADHSIKFKNSPQIDAIATIKNSDNSLEHVPAHLLQSSVAPGDISSTGSKNQLQQQRIYLNGKEHSSTNIQDPTNIKDPDYDVTNMGNVIESNQTPHSPNRREILNNYYRLGNIDTMPLETKVPFKEFANRAIPRVSSQRSPAPLQPDLNPILCGKRTEKNLSLPALAQDKAEWCTWALSPTGGRVVVGKSWGELQRNKDAKERFDDFNCNGFSKGINPSCNDEWGDEQVFSWRKALVPTIGCEKTRPSKVSCYDNQNNDRMCVFENAQINFGMMFDVDRGQGMTMTRGFEKGFFSVDCDPKSDADYLKFKHLYDTKVCMSVLVLI